ncbi:MAG: alpha/beta fold hydrolase [Nitrospiraceae bacterium]
MRAQINGIQLAYSDEGRGTPIVFLHAFPVNRTMWAPQVEAFSARYRVITVDLRGHGESDAPLWPASMEQFADDVNALLDHLSIPTAVIAGLSMGGYVTFALYRKYSQRVRALVLSNTRAQPDTEEGRAGRFQMAQLAYTKGAMAIAEAMLPKLLSSASLQSNPALVDKVRAMITVTSLGGIAGDLMGMAERPDSVPLLGSLACPTLVIGGEQDVATPPTDARFMAERIPGARLEIIPGAGHLSNLEQPAAYNRAVQSLLSSCQ